MFSAVAAWARSDLIDSSASLSTCGTGGHDAPGSAAGHSDSGGSACDGNCGSRGGATGGSNSGDGSGSDGVRGGAVRGSNGNNGDCGGAAAGGIDSRNGSGSGRFALGDARPDPALDQLLPLVRFPLMSGRHLAALERHPLARVSAMLRELLEEARKCHAAEEALQRQQQTPRAGTQVREGVCLLLTSHICAASPLAL